MFAVSSLSLAKLYAPRLESLAQQFGSKGVAFFGVNSNLQDTPTRIAAFARQHGVSFPILKDPGNKVADAFGAVRTPEVFLLDAKRAVRYRGRVDDQYVVGIQKPKVGRRDLATAIEELLVDKPVSKPVTKALGCFIGRVRNIKPGGKITYSKHIAKIFNSHCIECHREGELGPFPLTSYDEVVGWAETIREVVADNRMPPWFADPKHGHFANDISLSQEEKQLLYQWVENGAPQGDPADLPTPPKFVKGWRIDKPDAVFRMASPYSVPAEGTVDYQYFLIDPQLTEDIWVSGAEARPGNSEVVHHIVVYAVPERYKTYVTAMIAYQRAGGKMPALRIPRRRPTNSAGNKQDNDRKNSNQNPGRNPRPGRRRDRGVDGGAGALGQMVAIYAPGVPPWRYPQGAAMKIAKGSLFFVQMHYTPNGTKQSDQSYFGFNFVKAEQVKKRIRYGMAVNPTIEIPPHDEDYSNTAGYTFRRDTLVLNLFPHMHYRGKSFRFEAIYPDKSREVLLDVPHYDFNWQLRYDLAKPKLMPEGTRLLCTGHFDNSENNLLNPDPTRTVRFGLQSWEEMLVGYFTYVAANEDLTVKE